MPRAKKLKTLKIKLSIQIEVGGMEQFIGVVQAIYNAGYISTAKKMAAMVVETAQQQGAEVPAELEKFSGM